MGIYIQSIGVIGPGFEDWAHCKAVLSAKAPYEPKELPKLVPALLSGNERRRATPTIKLALSTAEQAIAGLKVAPDTLSSVFAASNGDLRIVDRVCADILLPGQPVSPTQFHNSVHNAPAGYWAIATKSQHPSNSISAGRSTFAAGIMEAATLAAVEGGTVLLVVYDHPVSGALDAPAGIEIPFGIAILLSASETSPCEAIIEIVGVGEQTPGRMQSKALDALCEGNSAAYGLLMLEAIANNSAQDVLLPFVANKQLQLNVKPCP